MSIVIKNQTQLAHMREAARILAKTFALMEASVRPGITTGELCRIAETFIRANGGVPTFLGYRGFPAAICVSVNEEVIHGIPGLRRLKNGDIVSIDMGVCKNSFNADAARTYPVGEILPEHARLIEVTRQSYFEGAALACAGLHLHGIGAAVEAYVARHGFSVVREWCGHGIGRTLHEDPQIPHYKMDKRGPRLAKGMTLCIEPMVNEGGHEVKILEDTWTVATVDGKYSAHYENTLIVTDGAPEIITL